MCLQLPASVVTRAPFDISYLISEVQNKEGFFCSWCVVIMAQILSSNKSSPLQVLCPLESTSITELLRKFPFISAIY